jgi:hypothetical protein
MSSSSSSRRVVGHATKTAATTVQLCSWRATSPGPQQCGAREPPAGAACLVVAGLARAANVTVSFGWLSCSTARSSSSGTQRFDREAIAIAEDSEQRLPNRCRAVVGACSCSCSPQYPALCYVAIAMHVPLVVLADVLVHVALPRCRGKQVCAVLPCAGWRHQPARLQAAGAAALGSSAAMQHCYTAFACAAETR